jgi:hypothetical protein
MMWILPTVEHKLVSVILSDSAVICCWLERAEKGSAPLLLRAYKRYDLTAYELLHLMLFNPTVIAHHISSFLHSYALKNAFVVYIFDGKELHEKYVAMPTSTPQAADFGIAYDSNALSEYRYLYADDVGQHLFYVYTMPRTLLLQYQLCAIATDCNLITMTTKTMMLLEFYKKVFGVAFRRSQFGIDMMRCNNNIERLIAVDTLSRIVAGVTADMNRQDRVWCAAIAGALCAERI